MLEKRKNRKRIELDSKKKNLEEHARKWFNIGIEWTLNKVKALTKEIDKRLIANFYTEYDIKGDRSGN